MHLYTNTLCVTGGRDHPIAVCPDFFRENARVIAQKARKNAPA